MEPGRYLPGGATVANAGDIVQDTNDDTWYRWDDLATLPKTVPVGSTPGSTGGTGDGKWQPVDVSDVLRKDLAKPSGASLSGFQNGQPSSVPTTVGNKLRTSIDLAVDFVDGGVISGQPDLTANLQAAIVAAFNLGLSEVSVVGDFKISSTILLYPGVTLEGGGYDKTFIRASASFPTGETMLRSFRPAMWNAGCHNAGVKDCYFVGRSAKDINAIDLNDSSYYELKRVRADLFKIAFSFNRWIDEGRVQKEGGGYTYPRAASPDIGGQCYFGKVEQCAAIDCITVNYYAGVWNRNTYISNTWSSSDLAYKFSNTRGVYETNTFISCNIEGCKVVWEWFFSINSPYNNTWITTSIDNSNSYPCLAKDPGRQTFINLALFPYNNSDFVSFYGVNPDGSRSSVFGSNWQSGESYLQIPSNISREPLHALNGLFSKQHGTIHIDKTFAADEQKTYSIPIPGLLQGSAIAMSTSKSYPTLNMSCASITAGEVIFSIYNGTSGPVVVEADIYVSPISKSYY